MEIATWLVATVLDAAMLGRMFKLLLEAWA